MKLKKLLVCFLILGLALKFNVGETNAQEVGLLSKDYYHYSITMIYDDYNSIPSSIWHDTGQYKGYLYRSDIRKINNRYVVKFSGNLLKGPFVPINIENLITE